MCEKLCVHSKRVATLVFARPSQDVVLQGKGYAAAHAAHITHLISSCEGPPPRRLAAAAGASNIPASQREAPWPTGLSPGIRMPTQRFARPLPRSGGWHRRGEIEG